MRYASIRSFDVSNGEGIGVALFTQGCKFHCKNCFNQETWDLDGGKLWTSLIEDQVMCLLNRPGITRLSILGGEPLLDRNIEELVHLFKRVKEVYGNDITIWLYSGYTYEVITKQFPDIIANIDVLVDGLYVEELRDLNLYFRGSSNQRVINVKTGELMY